MRIRIITISKMVYNINVNSNDFDEVVDKILSKQFVKLDKNTVLLTSSICSIQKALD